MCSRVERLFQQRIVVKIDLPDRQVVRGTPIGVQLAHLYRSQGLCASLHLGLLDYPAVSAARERHTERAIVIQLDAEEVQAFANALADARRMFGDASGDDERVHATPAWRQRRRSTSWPDNRTAPRLPPLARHRLPARVEISHVDTGTAARLAPLTSPAAHFRPCRSRPRPAGARPAYARRAAVEHHHAGRGRPIDVCRPVSGWLIPANPRCAIADSPFARPGGQMATRAPAASTLSTSPCIREPGSFPATSSLSANRSTVHYRTDRARRRIHGTRLAPHPRAAHTLPFRHWSFHASRRQRRRQKRRRRRQARCACPATRERTIRRVPARHRRLACAGVALRSGPSLGRGWPARAGRDPDHLVSGPA